MASRTPADGLRAGYCAQDSALGTATLPVQPRRLDRLDHVFIDHDLKAAALWANGKVALIRRGGCR